MALLDFIHPAFILAVAVVSFLAYTVVESKRAKLDHIPGPWLAKYTDAWRCYQAWKVNHYKHGGNYQIDMIGKYGDVVRIGPNIVLVYDPEAISSIYGFKERLEKGPGYKVFVMSGATQTALVGIRDEQTHGQFRRPIAHAYSLSSLKGYEPYIDATIEKLIQILDRHDAANQPINMSRYLHYWAFDVVSKISFGEPIGFLDHESDFNGMIKSQKQIFRYISVVNNMPLLDQLLKRNPLLKITGKKPSVFFTFAQDVVAKRLALADRDPEKPTRETTQHPDLLASFIASRKTYPLMNQSRLTHLSTTNVVAGANNSALAMDQTIHYLATHPEVQDQLHAEITQLHHDQTETSSADSLEGPAALSLALQLPHLEALITESYRTFGSPANNLERVVPPTGLTLPSGPTLPAGAVVAMNAPAMSMLPDVYATRAAPVSAFDPARWMRGPGEDEAVFRERRARMDRGLLVFGHGSRSCIGKNVVQLELFKVWATLLRVYKFEPVDVKLHDVMVIPRRRERRAGVEKAVKI